MNSPPESGKTDRYVSRDQTANIAVELSFTGSAEVGVSNPKQTQVQVRCMWRESAQTWVEKWRVPFGDLDMPQGAWHGVDLVALKAGHIVVGLSHELHWLSPETGEVLKKVATGNTPIGSLLLSTKHEQIIVYNGYYGFEDPDGFGNISAYDFNGNQIWRCKLPSPSDIFANPPCYMVTIYAPLLGTVTAAP